MSEFKLTQYSHGAGCGCKLSPAVLTQILGESGNTPSPIAQLLVGNEARDDAAAYDWGDEHALLATTDFFMPIVDDAHTFGQIAATNAISDIYAMGGMPFLALGILGWPVSELPAEVAGRVLSGARDVCKRAGIPLAGGHSIESPEPIFGLAVNGRVAKKNLKRNDTAQAGDILYLTKPLGLGILATAQKRGIVRPDDHRLAIQAMTTLNHLGPRLAEHPTVHAMTDVTGFGLLGHLREMCRGSQLRAELDRSAVPTLIELETYLAQGCIPGGAQRNWESFAHDVAGDLDAHARAVLSDPQTSGGLLFAASKMTRTDLEEMADAHPYPMVAIGTLSEISEDKSPCIEVA